jgi:hypothetical protein
MNTRYRFYENGLPVYATREDVRKQISTDSQDVERDIDVFLKSRYARRVYDGFLNEYQLAARLTSAGVPRGVELDAQVLLAQTARVADTVRDPDTESLEWRQKLSADLGAVLWAVARLSDALGVSLSVIAERDLNGRQGE